MKKTQVLASAKTMLRTARVMIGVAAVAAVAACNIDNVLKVDAPSRIPADQLADPKNAKLLVNGAIGDFECAAGAYAALSAVLAQEMVDATQTAARWPYDRRDVRTDDALYATAGCEGLGVYTPLSTARYSADLILGKLQEWTDQQVAKRQDLIANAAAYSGYTYVLLGEGFCSMAIDLSREMTSQEIFAVAEQRFTTAIAAAQAAGNNDILNMAYVGRARARLDLGNLAGAAADARNVPLNYVHNVTASAAPSRRVNRIYAQNGVGSTGGLALSVGPSYRAVTYAGQPDPRVRVVDAGRTASEGTRIFLQTKFGSLSTPLPIATGVEAQLIVAEAVGGQAAVDIINALHARANLPQFSSTDPTAIKNQVIEERRRELWLQGHRFYDIRRLGLPLDPAPGTTYHKGGTFGDTRCLPLPDVERLNNPNIGK